MLDTRFDQRIFDWATHQDPENLHQAVVTESDRDKQAVYAALYDYALAKAQEKLIQRQDFAG